MIKGNTGIKNETLDLIYTLIAGYKPEPIDKKKAAVERGMLISDIGLNLGFDIKFDDL
ncbi:MAG: hypothetical protein LIQ31_01590 [Planctomycetes bacterium]|nr:hypothetical protein [Planctomycetota bacterium]